MLFSIRGFAQADGAANEVDDDGHPRKRPEQETTARDRRLRGAPRPQKPLGTVGAVITLVLLLVGIFADWLAPYGTNDVHVGASAGAVESFLLGTDNLGRDILSRVIFGAHISVIVGLVASSVPP